MAALLVNQRPRYSPYSRLAPGPGTAIPIYRQALSSIFIINIKGNLDMSRNLSLWSPRIEDLEKDTHLLFRGIFELSDNGNVEFHISGASWFQIFLDGEFFEEGPARFHPQYPEYTVNSRTLDKGLHILSAQVNHAGLDTRLLKNIQPFLLCETFISGKPLPIQWKCTKCPGYTPALRRVNGCLGWMEWLNTKESISEGWKQLAFYDRDWILPSQVSPLPPNHVPWKPVSGATTFLKRHAPKLIASGLLSEEYGYEKD
jgi:alpha-L-rhamnosidase